MNEVRRVDIAPCVKDISRLWVCCFGPSWAVEPRSLCKRLLGAESGCRSISLGIYKGDRLIGFVAAQHCEGRTEAGLVVLLVDPDYQRLGLGSHLCHEALVALSECGVRSVRLGAGGASYFWPGVPHSCAGAMDFFQAQCWTVEEKSHDLVQDISDYTRQVPLPKDVEISHLRPENSDELIKFVEIHFPGWISVYSRAVRAGHLSDVITARCNGRIVGVTHISAAEQRDGHPWQPVLGIAMGELGAVGVDERYRCRGIGLSMVDLGTHQLRKRGVRNCLVGWTWLTEWYAKLGYRIWHTYDMCIRDIRSNLATVSV